ncbi:MAG TPA: DUF3304 domain-containing protein [Noviherbaspirillum sp.]|nr:DUF3304 domain-containing protein [Noviherbaspirillum sp.]
MKQNAVSTLLLGIGLAGMALLLSACATTKSKTEERSGATIRSLNYSSREIFSISAERPGEPNSGGGGDALNPYSSGGAICCFSVPSVWRPDIKVVVRYRFYPEPEYRQALVTLPPYPDGKASQIWLIVHEDETAEAVVSHYGPSREEWPGKVKGYPVPSREYRLKLWERKMEQEQEALNRFQKVVRDPNLSEEKRKGYQETIQQISEGIQYLERAKP